MPYSPADQTPQHVAATFVRWHDLVSDEESHRPAVIGHDAERDIRSL